MRKTSTYARKRAHKDAFALTRHEVINPVTEAVVRQRIEAQVQRLRTDTGLQAYMGDDAARIANIAETPAELERQRGAVIAGLQAIDRLMPKLHTFSLAAGTMELDNLLHTANGMGTADVRRALGMA